MIDGKRSAAQRVADRFRRVQDEGAAENRGHAAEGALLLLGPLLHVVAFAVSRLVAVDMINADAVRRRRQRAGEGLHRAGPDRRDHGGQFVILPAQRGGRMRHLDFVAAIDRAGRALLLIDAQDIAEIGRAMAEYGEIFSDPLLQQAKHQRFRQRSLDHFWHGALGQRFRDAAGVADGAGTRAHLAVVIVVESRQHFSWSSRSRPSGSGSSWQYPP